MMILKIGDKVAWRGSWGSGPLQEATVESITVTDYPREKYGDDRDKADWDLVRLNRVCVSLDNGHWAYGSQISPSGTNPNTWHHR
tara:strand:- start:5647 stop:5901 length:255 start_codon:yes stop_codon:yes gene_type:complete